MPEDNRDILMMLEITPGKYLLGECAAIVDPDSDELADGFSGTQHTSRLVKGNYFAINDFTFKAGISDPGVTDPQKAQEKKEAQDQLDDVTRQVNKAVSQLQRQNAQLLAYIDDLQDRLAVATGGKARGRSGGLQSAGTIASTGKNGKFSDFMRTGKPGDRPYPSDLDEIQVTKDMDYSSPVIFEKCLASFKFESATILKRRAVGGVLKGYLRIDFKQVMLTSLDWKDDEVVEETFNFVCREAVVQYAMESASQQDVTIVGNATWSMLKSK